MNRDGYSRDLWYPLQDAAPPRETLIGLTGPDCAGRDAVADYLQHRLGWFRLYFGAMSIAAHTLHALRQRQLANRQGLAVICGDILTEPAAAWVRAEGGTVVHVVMHDAAESPAEFRTGDLILCRGETATLDELLHRAEGLARDLAGGGR